MSLKDPISLATIGSLVVALLAFLLQSWDIRRRSKEERRRVIDDRSLQAEHWLDDLQERKIVEYTSMVHDRGMSGLSAASALGLEGLGSDQKIRTAIEQMRRRTRVDPLGGKRDVVEDVSLLRLFRYVSLHDIDLSTAALEDIVRQVRQDGGVRYPIERFKRAGWLLHRLDPRTLTVVIAVFLLCAVAGVLLKAFYYGPPNHGEIALGLDKTPTEPHTVAPTNTVTESRGQTDDSASVRPQSMDNSYLAAEEPLADATLGAIQVQTAAAPSQTDLDETEGNLKSTPPSSNGGEGLSNVRTEVPPGPPVSVPAVRTPIIRGVASYFVTARERVDPAPWGFDDANHAFWYQPDDESAGRFDTDRVIAMRMGSRAMEYSPLRRRWEIDYGRLGSTDWINCQWRTRTSEWLWCQWGAEHPPFSGPGWEANWPYILAELGSRSGEWGPYVSDVQEAGTRQGLLPRHLRSYALCFNMVGRGIARRPVPREKCGVCPVRLEGDNGSAVYAIIPSVDPLDNRRFAPPCAQLRGGQ